MIMRLQTDSTGSRLLGVLCLFVVATTLVLGLWPFHAPTNRVKWAVAGNGLAFDGAGVAWSSGPLKAGTGTAEGSSIELWAEPDRWSTSATILSIYEPENRILFRLRQLLANLELTESVNGPRDISGAIEVGEVFSPALYYKKAVFITVATNFGGTDVYVDGVLAKRVPVRASSNDFAGRLIVGDSPWQPDGFRGCIRGIALYDSKLDAIQVNRHFQAWMKNLPLSLIQEGRLRALYKFDEHSGRTIHDDLRAGSDLRIPNTYAVIDKLALEPFWKEFDFSDGYWEGNIKNIVGFLPLGISIYAWCFITGFKRPMFATLSIGLLGSVTIEILQAFLPTRDSGTTDLITNTLGTFIGAQCYLRICPGLGRRFPILDWFCKSPAIPQAGSCLGRPTAE